MRTRRLVLATGLGLLVLSAAYRPAAAGDVGEVEAAAYGGQSSGGWVCGPGGRVAYGGLGADVRLGHRGLRDEEGPGVNGVAGVSGEHQSTTVSPCGARCDAETTDDTSAPPARVMLGGHTRVGWEGRYFGVQGGGGIYQSWASNTSVRPELRGYPELELRSGGRVKGVKIQGVSGFGSATVTTIQRPGLYAGASVTTEEGYAADVRGGLYRSGPAGFDSTASRFDLLGRVPVTPGLAVRGGAAMAFPEDGDAADFEGSIGIVAGF